MINAFLSFIKWPLGFLLLFLVFPTTLAVKDILFVWMDKATLIWFCGPAIVTGIFFLFVPWLSGSFLAIAEHEITHMLFALLTGHAPVDLSVEQDKGGTFSFRGKGNWLIALGPYFFPTFAMLIMLGSLFYIFLDEKIPMLYWAVLGVMTGYHISSTILEIHPKQTDFKVAGYLFSIVFLPGANLLMYGLILAFARYQWDGVPRFISLLSHYTYIFMERLWQLI